MAYAGKNFGGGFKVLAGLVGGPGAEPPGRQRIFENLQKNFLKKIAKMHYFSIFFEKFKKPCVNFTCVWTKNTNSWEFLIDFRKFSKNIFWKFRTIHYFSIFFKRFNKPCVNFSRVWTKNTIGWGNFEKILRFFENLQNIPEEKCKNCCIFAYFAKKLQNHALNFRAFGRKTPFVGEILRKFWNFLMKIQ